MWCRSMWLIKTAVNHLMLSVSLTLSLYGPKPKGAPFQMMSKKCPQIVYLWEDINKAAFVAIWNSWTLLCQSFGANNKLFIFFIEFQR